jgi:hypothetical protein
VIYCVVPEELAGELYDRLADYYEDDPNVTVIVDRRKRGSADAPAGEERRGRPATPPADALPSSATE